MPASQPTNWKCVAIKPTKFIRISWLCTKYLCVCMGGSKFIFVHATICWYFTVSICLYLCVLTRNLNWNWIFIVSYFILCPLRADHCQSSRMLSLTTLVNMTTLTIKHWHVAHHRQPTVLPLTLLTMLQQPMCQCSFVTHQHAPQSIPSAVVCVRVFVYDADWAHFSWFLCGFYYQSRERHTLVHFVI